MFILYLAEFSSFWFQCTRSEPRLVPALWQAAQVEFGRSVAFELAVAPVQTPLSRAKTWWLVSQSEPVLLAWQVRQVDLAVTVFQLSPCGVAGLALEWQVAQLRRSCGKPTSA